MKGEGQQGTKSSSPSVLDGAKGSKSREKRGSQAQLKTLKDVGFQSLEFRTQELTAWRTNLQQVKISKASLREAVLQ